MMIEQDIQLSVTRVGDLSLIKFLYDGVQRNDPTGDAYISRGRQRFLNELLRSSLTYESLGIREARNRFAVSASA